MKKNLKNIIATLAIVFAGVVMAAPANAADANLKSGEYNKVCDLYVIESGMSADEKAEIERLRAAAGCDTAEDANVMDNVRKIINVAVAAVGIIAVLVIVVSGQRLVVANGDANKIKQAKSMLLYAVIAVVVAILAYAVVNFVAAAIAENGGAGSSV
jgi:hypothetical protein